MSTARHPLQVLASLSVIGGLPERLAIENDIGVAGDHIAIALNGPRLHPSVLDHLELRIPTRQLIDPGHHDLELDPQLAENLPPLRGAGSQDEAGRRA